MRILPQEGMYLVDEENVLKLMLSADTFESEKSPAYIGVRVTDLDFSLSTRVEIEKGYEGKAGLVYLHDEQNYVKWVLERAEEGAKLSLVHIEDGIANILYREKTENNAPCLKLELQDMLIRAYVDGNRIEASIAAEDLTSERKGGFTGCTMGVYAEGTGKGYAVFNNTEIV